MENLFTERLILRKISKDDYPELFRIWHNKALIRLTYHVYMETLEDSRQRVKKVISHYAEYGGHFGPYLIFRGATCIGYCGLDLKSGNAKEYELFYIIDNAHQGKGYGTEVSKKLTDFAFLILGAEKVAAEVVADNTPSIRILEKTGMTRESCLKDKFHNGNDYHDLAKYVLLKHEWQAKKTPKS